MGEALTQTRPEGVNDSADNVRKMLDRFNDRLTLDNPRLIERYDKAEIHLLVRFSVGVGNQQFIARFERWTDLGGIKVDRLECPSRERLPHRLTHECAEIDRGSCIGCQQHSMLVNSVHAIENGKCLSLTSIVRLDSAQNVYSILPKALYFSHKTGFELLGVAVCRKGDVSKATVTRVIDNPQLLNEVVQSTPKILNRISSNRCDRNWNGLCSCEIVGQLASVAIALGPNFIGVGTEEGADLGIQIEDVFFGPFDFGVDQRVPFV